jgi:predicted metallo-beta-lactamase superfamily hydrolase
MSKQTPQDREQETTLEKSGALWSGRGKVAYTGVIETDIKAGTKILLFANDQDGNAKRPVYRIVSVIPVE